MTNWKDMEAVTAYTVKPYSDIFKKKKKKSIPKSFLGRYLFEINYKLYFTNTT